MKKVSKILSLCCVLLLLGTGACLPFVSSVFLDRQLKQKVTRRDVSQDSVVGLEDNSFLKKLASFNSRQAKVELTAGYQMSEKDVIAAADRYLPLLSGIGGAYQLLEVNPVLVANEDDPDKSGIYWLCIYIEETEKETILWLDDKSGLPVAFQGRFYTATVAEGEDAFIEQNMTLEVFLPQAERIAEFCRNNYPTSGVTLSHNIEGEKNQYMLELTGEEDGTPVVFTVPVQFSGDWMYFNLW